MALRCFFYSRVAGLAVPAASLAIEDNKAFCEQLPGLPLPAITELVFRYSHHSLVIGALFFILAFSVLVLMGMESESKSAQALGVALVLTLSFGLADGLWWASDLPRQELEKLGGGPFVPAVKPAAKAKPATATTKAR